MRLQTSFGDGTIYFYFMENFTFPFLTSLPSVCMAYSLPHVPKSHSFSDGLVVVAAAHILHLQTWRGWCTFHWGPVAQFMLIT